jgi:hypothetical protein
LKSQQNRVLANDSWKFQVTEFRVVTEWQKVLSWAGCTTNIDWKKWRREKQAKTQNDEVFAEHSPAGDN